MATPWVEIVDPRSKELMYANITTGDCSWDAPDGVEVRQMTDDQWWELYDNDCECYYYYCAATQQTVWERPEDSEVIPLSKLQSFQDTMPRSPTPRLSTEGSVSSAGAVGDIRGEEDPVSNIDDVDVSAVSNGDTPVNNGFHTATTSQEPVVTAEGEATEQAQYAEDADYPPPDAATAEYDPAQYDQSQYDQSQYDQSQYDQSQYDQSQYDQSQYNYSTDEAAAAAAAPATTEASYDATQYTQDGGGYDDTQYQQDNDQSAHDQSGSAADEFGATAATTAAVPENSTAEVHGAVPGPSVPPAAPSLPPADKKFNIASFDRFDKPKSRRSFFSFKKKVTIENLLSWTKDPLTHPMLRTNDKKRKKEALDMFKQLLVYMGDKRSKLKDRERDLILHEIIGRTWTTTQLRDELFVQLCRQTTGNKNKKSLHAGWEVMCTALSFFPPSSMFHSYLEGYMYKHLPSSPIQDLKSADSPVQVYAQYCTKRLEQMRISGAKKGQKKPSLEEVEHGRNLPYNPSMFGDTLRDVFEMQLSTYPDSRVPWILATLAKEVLKLNAKSTEGIFRVPGDIDEVNTLKLRIDRFEVGDLRDPHVPASLLKLWFRELLDPVIPPELYDRCIRCAGSRDEVLAIVDELPELNRNVLFYIVHFLQQFVPTTVSYYTKMDLNNLAMVWAPNCLRCPYDDPTVLFENTRKEMTFVRTLVNELDTRHWEGIEI
eukprot:scpid50616/ scgid23504/ Rho GTPase-activating protein 39